MGGIRSLSVVIAGLAIVAGCGSGGSSSTATVTVTETSTSSGAGPSSAAKSWTMPDLTGRNLQEAQDAIQALTDDAVFYTGSTDLTGQSRKQVMDRNWQVCTSTPAPGARLTKGSTIDFGVVRIDGESCP